MKCTCSSVDDGEGGTLVKHCPIHHAGPELLRVLVQLLNAIRERDKGDVVAYGKATIDQVVQEAFADAKRVVGPLASLYYERSRGIRKLPDAGEPPSRK